MTPEEEKHLDEYRESVERWLKARNAPPEIMERAREHVKALKQAMDASPGKIRFGRVGRHEQPPS
jgi:hypothetical protein